jgi:hypothetical protein
MLPQNDTMCLMEKQNVILNWHLDLFYHHNAFQVNCVYHNLCIICNISNIQYTLTFIYF